MKPSFLEMMLIILGMIGISILILSVWFAVFLGVENISDIAFKFNLLAFLTGISYILFIIVILRLVRKKDHSSK
jgi:hypothetical protein